MRYLFIGGSQDGKHREVSNDAPGCSVECKENGLLLGYENYTKRMICYDNENGACSVFAEMSIPDKQIIWRLVTNYKKVVA